MTGRDLLARVRADGGIASLDADTRAALIAALLSDFQESDADLIVELTRAEALMLSLDHISVDQDGLLACCWMLFMIGRLSDAQVIFGAKMTDYDTYCGIDSIFLLPHGLTATREYATAHGMDDLASFIADLHGDLDAHAQQWKHGTYFDDRPGADSLVGELTAWIRQ